MKETTTSRSGKLVYFVTEDWYFCSHRLSLAIAAREAGYSVSVITRVNAHGGEIEKAGLHLIPFEISRRSKNPFTELIVVWRLARIYKKLKPDIAHHVALKPVIYGSIAARIGRVGNVVNAMAGLGFLFSSGRILARVLRPFVRVLFSLLLNNRRTTVILQNPDDVEVLCGAGSLSRDRARLIMGSGVDTEIYQFHAEPTGLPVVLLASRLLWDKGVGDFVEAARELRQQGIEARFVLAGDSDEENPGSISREQIDAWTDTGFVEWWGRCSNMPEVFAGVHVVCLPTAYGEGVPKVLIEAASCGRPIIATDAPGCREIVVDGENGLLVPVGNVDALAKAILQLVQSPELREKMGRAGRQRVKDHFSIERVISATLGVYEKAAR